MSSVKESVLTDDCRAAQAALRRAQTAPPLVALQEADVAERALVRLRDELIARLRADPRVEAAARWHQALQRANAALSLVAGIDYPISALPRETIGKAETLVRSMLDDQLV